jgi:lambda family phage portal protein
MFGWLSKLWGGGKRSRNNAGQPAAPRAIKARYDAAQTTAENSKHWGMADALSATAAHDPATRKKLRERSRYEVNNNSYAKGIIQSLANNLIGPGPRLQVQTPDQSLNAAIQAGFAEWSRATRLPDQLRTMCQAKKVDGESFGVLTTNPALPTAVRLDIRLIEADQVTSPHLVALIAPNAVDGIHFDDYRNPASYDVLKYHPGDVVRWGDPLAYDSLPASRMLHWFRADRPGQARGVPELTPALPLFAQLRRFTLATLTAAETAAMFAAVIQTSATADEDDPVTPFSTADIERGMMTALPDGYTMEQFRAEHPATTYEMFVRLILREIARCLGVPWNVAAGDSSAYNYSSARLDHLNYWEGVGVERQDLESEVLDPLLSAWLAEAILIPGLVPMSVRAFLTCLPHTWHWPARPYIDPTTEAAADTARLTNGTTTLAAVCAARGDDWQEVIRQRAREQQYAAQVAAELNVPAPAAPTAAVHGRDCPSPSRPAPSRAACGSSARPRSG